MFGSLFGISTAPKAPQKLPDATSKNPLTELLGATSRPGEQLFSLGEDPWPQFTTTSANTSTPKAPPSSEKDNSQCLAEQVRSLTQKRLAAAWSRLREEFGVQSLVWDSLERSRGAEFRGTVEPIISAIKEGFSEQSKNPNSDRAVKLISQALDLDSSGTEHGEMSKSMVEAINLLKKEAMTPARDMRSQLAQKLATASNPACLPKTDLERKQWEDIVSRSALEDPKLETSIRRLLTLSIPSALCPKASPKSSPAGKRSSSKRSSVTTTKSGVAPKSSGKHGSRTRSLGAPTTGAKMSSMMRTLPAPIGDVGKAVNGISVNSSMPAPEKSANAARKVRTMASESIEQNWKALQAEFDVQKMVWDSLRLQRKLDVELSSQIQTTLEGAMAARKQNPTMALKTLEELVKKFDSNSKSNLMSNGMLKAMSNLVEMPKTTNRRTQLAERLDTAAIPATLPTRASDKRELEALLISCNLGDTKLENTIRKMLLLPLPKENVEPVESLVTTASVGGAVTQFTTFSLLSSGLHQGGEQFSLTAEPAKKKTTSSKRPLSTGAIRGDRRNNVAERARNNEMEVPSEYFDPPRRSLLVL